MFQMFQMFTDVHKEKQMKHGARNDMVGKVSEIKTGDGVMASAKVNLSGDFVVSSVMTQESLDSLGIQEGDNVRVLIKAVNVLLVKD